MHVAATLPEPPSTESDAPLATPHRPALVTPAAASPIATNWSEQIATLRRELSDLKREFGSGPHRFRIHRRAAPPANCRLESPTRQLIVYVAAMGRQCNRLSDGIPAPAPAHPMAVARPTHPAGDRYSGCSAPQYSLPSVSASSRYSLNIALFSGAPRSTFFSQLIDLVQNLASRPRAAARPLLNVSSR